jgi:hypothetical protein
MLTGRVQVLQIVGNMLGPVMPQRRKAELRILRNKGLSVMIRAALYEVPFDLSFSSVHLQKKFLGC